EGDGSFLRTGDLGFVWEDQLYITGRLKDLIILSGRNLYPSDLERVAERAHPHLRLGGCAAFSITHNDQERLVIVAEVTSASQTDEVTGAIREAIAASADVPVHQVVL